MTVVGFTGSRTEPTEEQLRWLVSRLRELQPTELHHGACVGADRRAHLTARVLKVETHVHPPHDTSRVVGDSVATADVVYVPDGFIARDHHIVDACDRLIALPNGPEIIRSGTWATIRYARSIGRPVELCFPDGTVVDA